MKVLITLIVMKLYLLIASTAFTETNLYGGLKYGQLNVDRSTVDGYDLDNFAPTEFSFYDVFIGYNLNKNFFAELGYVKSDKEPVTGSQTVNSITITGTNISQEFDGFRLGAGYKHQVKDGLLIKPFLNYYEVDVTSSGTFVASSGSATATASISGTQGENWTEAGLGISYIINKFDVGLSYSKSVSDMDEVEDTDIISLNLSYNF